MSQIHEGIYVREEKKVVVEFQVAMEYGGWWNLIRGSNPSFIQASLDRDRV